MASMSAVTHATLPMDRKALVARHRIVFTELSPAESPEVGNGQIALGIDVTGLQTFYENTLSQ